MIILDGGIGTELCARGAPFHPAYWSALSHITYPELMLQIHLDYIHAGAEIISSNTMMASRHVLEAGGVKDFIHINQAAVNIAHRARQQSGKNAKIAGCMSTLPPLNEVNTIHSTKEMARNYTQQAECLVDAGVDLILIEMLIESSSAAQIIESCIGLGVPVWAGMSAMRSGPVGDDLYTFRQKNTLSDLHHDRFCELVECVCQYPLDMIGVMHTEADTMKKALEELRLGFSGAAFAYAHCGHGEAHQWRFSNIDAPQASAKKALDWVETFDLSAIGGCCGTNPQHIQALIVEKDSHIVI